MTSHTQIGILFGFVAAFIIVIVSYGLAWRLYNKREEKVEAARKASLVERGFGSEKIEGEKGKGKGNGYHDESWGGVGGQGAAGIFGPGVGSG